MAMEEELLMHTYHYQPPKMTAKMRQRIMLLAHERIPVGRPANND